MATGVYVNKHTSHLKVALLRFYKLLQKSPTSLRNGKKTKLIIRKMAQQEELISGAGSVCVDR